VQTGNDIDRKASGDPVNLSSDGSIVAITSRGNFTSGDLSVFNDVILSINANTFGDKFLAYPNPS